MKRLRDIMERKEGGEKTPRAVSAHQEKNQYQWRASNGTYGRGKNGKKGSSSRESIPGEGIQRAGVFSTSKGDSIQGSAKIHEFRG